MQAAIVMLMTLNGLGCHHKTCFADSYPAAGCYTAPSAYASSQGGGGPAHWGGSPSVGCYSSFYNGYACYDGCYSSCYVSCYVSPHSGSGFPYMAGCYVTPHSTIGGYYDMGMGPVPTFMPGPGVYAPMYGSGEISSTTAPAPAPVDAATGSSTTDDSATSDESTPPDTNENANNPVDDLLPPMDPANSVPDDATAPPVEPDLGPPMDNDLAPPPDDQPATDPN